MGTKGNRRGDLAAVGIFLVFATSMALLAGISLAFPGSRLDRMWSLNPRAYVELSPMRPWVGPAFLFLALMLLIAAVGWFRRKFVGHPGIHISRYIGSADLAC